MRNKWFAFKQENSVVGYPGDGLKPNRQGQGYVPHEHSHGVPHETRQVVRRGYIERLGYVEGLKAFRASRGLPEPTDRRIERKEGNALFHAISHMTKNQRMNFYKEFNERSSI